MQTSTRFFTLVPVDDPVTSFVEIMKGINTSKYFDCSHRGNKGYDPNMMLQVVLFAFMNGESELRKMEELCRYDIRYMWLSNEETPSFMAFQRFISEKLSMSIKDIFYDVIQRIMELDDVDMSKWIVNTFLYNFYENCLYSIGVLYPSELMLE